MGLREKLTWSVSSMASNRNPWGEGLQPLGGESEPLTVMNSSLRGQWQGSTGSLQNGVKVATDDLGCLKHSRKSEAHRRLPDVSLESDLLPLPLQNHSCALFSPSHFATNPVVTLLCIACTFLLIRNYSSILYQEVCFCL